MEPHACWFFLCQVVCLHNWYIASVQVISNMTFQSLPERVRVERVLLSLLLGVAVAVA